MLTFEKVLEVFQAYLDDDPLYEVCLLYTSGSCPIVEKTPFFISSALIRAEDMKKGVFSTIGQLPKEEPRKGSIAASAAV